MYERNYLDLVYKFKCFLDVAGRTLLIIPKQNISIERFSLLSTKSIWFESDKDFPWDSFMEGKYKGKEQFSIIHYIS